MSSPSKRRFPAPWTAVCTPGGYVVQDANNQPIAYVYGKPEDEFTTADIGHRLTMDEARRIAMGITRLPEFLSRSR